MKKAVCVLTNNKPGIKGFIEFKELSNSLMQIKINITGLTPGFHGFHIHQTGDLRKGCNSLCSHFNPYNRVHGDISDNRDNRHIGDLGNIIANTKGEVKTTIYDKLIKLRGKCNIIGRSVVIHDKSDDLGLGGLDEFGNIIDENIHNESLKTGNAGKRIACGVIGWVN